MTLHWWMHWFWITLLIFNAISLTLALPPESADKYNVATREYHDEDLAPVTAYSSTQDPPSERMGKSVGFTRKSSPAPTVLTKGPTFANPYPQSSDISDVGEEIMQREVLLIPTATVNKAEEEVSKSNNSNDNKSHDTMQSSQKEMNITKFNPEIETSIRQVSITNNNNETSINTEIKSNISARNSTSSNDTVFIEDTKENVTEKPVSLETTDVVERILSSLTVEPTKGKITLAAASIEDQPAEGSLDTAAVAGISFAALVLVALTGATSFVLYRRRYLNKPQTLNDKCSNPDSSAYIDDSTIRENSEEMYSLDNDSFLNSLEAMTIQNYWTDTVKHTKL